MNPPPSIGQLALHAGLLDAGLLEDLLRRQGKEFSRGRFRRLGELIAEKTKCPPAALRRLLLQQGITLVACELCGTRYNAIQFQGARACARCGRRLVVCTEDAPLTFEDVVTEAGPHADQVLAAFHLRNQARVGPYLILGEVGRGGMGVIYKAWDGGARRHVALKFLLQPEAMQYEDKIRFRREAEAIANLGHEHIVKALACEERDGLLYMAMEFVPGVSLDVLVRKAVLPPDRLVWVCARVAGALHHVHQAGLVHRDVKPGNVVVDAQGKPFLVDFGIAKSANESMSLTMEGEVLGSLAFMAPEYVTQGVEAVDPQCDVFGLGVVLYWVLSQRYPFGDPGEDEYVMRLVDEPPTPIEQARADVPAPLATIINRAISKDRAVRHETALELARELDGYLGPRA